MGWPPAGAHAVAHRGVLPPHPDANVLPRPIVVDCRGEGEMKLRDALWKQAKDADFVRFVFDQVRNVALIGVVAAAGLYFVRSAATGAEQWLHVSTGSLLFAFAVWLPLLEHWHISHWIDQRKMPKRAVFLLRTGMFLVISGIVAAAVQYSPSPPIFL